MLWRLETTVESELVGNGFLRARHVHVGYGQRVRAGKRVQGKGVQGDGRVRVCVITTFFYSVSIIMIFLRRKDFCTFCVFDICVCYGYLHFRGTSGPCSCRPYPGAECGLLRKSTRSPAEDCVFFHGITYYVSFCMHT